jgi:endoglucanase
MWIAFFPDEAFTDDVCSYSSSEIAINWNAPWFIAGAREALQYQSAFRNQMK